MASNTAVNPTEQPRELCRFVSILCSIKNIVNISISIDTFFLMYAVMVTNVFIHMIDRLVKQVMYAGFIYKENVVMVIDAGKEIDYRFIFLY